MSRRWQQALDVLAKREALLRRRRGRNWNVAPDVVRRDARGPTVRQARATARVREAIDAVFYDWRRQDDVLADVSYDLKLSPDARQAYVYWGREPPVRRTAVDLFSLFGAADHDDRIERYLERRLAELRLAVTRRARFKYSPEIKLFRRRHHPQNEGA